MPWTTKPPERSYACNVELLKFFRKRKSWSQDQLCEQADISVRVVSKAERGTAISTGSIDKLAAAFSTADHTVFPEDLISFPRALAQRLVTALHIDKQDVTQTASDIIDPDAIFQIAGDPKKIPFAGTHQGIRAYRRALKKFFQIFEIPADFDHTVAYEYFPKGTDVILWGTTRLKLIGSTKPAADFQHRKRFRFCRGLLISFEEHYDIGEGERKVANSAEVLGKHVYDPLEDSRSPSNHK